QSSPRELLNTCGTRMFFGCDRPKSLRRHDLWGRNPFTCTCLLLHFREVRDRRFPDAKWRLWRRGTSSDSPEATRAHPFRSRLACAEGRRPRLRPAEDLAVPVAGAVETADIAARRPEATEDHDPPVLELRDRAAEAGRVELIARDPAA